MFSSLALHWARCSFGICWQYLDARLSVEIQLAGSQLLCAFLDLQGDIDRT